MKKPKKRFDFMITVANYQYINELALKRTEEGEYDVSMATILNEVIDHHRNRLSKMRPASEMKQ